MAYANFLCVGAMRSGTTYLHNVLDQHPDICLPEIKETNFFDRASEYHRGLAFYEMLHFNHYNGEPRVGDFTPSVMYNPEAPGMIHEMLGPDVKLIFSLRNPAERAFSQYLHNYNVLKENRSFTDAVAAEPKRLDKGYWWAWSYGYLDRSLYARQVRRFLEYFPLENMFFIVLEDDYGPRAPATVGRLLRFLDLAPLPLPTDAPRHPREVRRVTILDKPLKVRRGDRLTTIPAGAILVMSRGKVQQYIFHPSSETMRFMSRHIRNRPTLKLDPDLRRWLIAEHFLDDIADLEDITGRDLSAWYGDIVVEEPEADRRDEQALTA